MKAALRGGHHLRLLEGGAQLFPAMARAIERAQHLVHVETYILAFAGGTLQLAEAMERAAGRGVAVRLVVDGVGTPALPRGWLRRLERAGVQCRVYAPLGHVGLLIPSRWRRLHRKLCVVDGVIGFCGGINLIDDLDDTALGRLAEPRLDFALQVSGPLVADMLEAMEQLWWRMLALTQARQHEFRAAWRALRAGLPALAAHHFGSEPAGRQPQPAALLLRDNLRHRHDIERAYLRAIALARREIVIANAYFIPGRRLRRALTLAAARGVRVRLLLQGRYEHFLQYHAARPVYYWLLRTGIEVHEYAPSALHAKVAVIDQAWATVGSTNLDPLSLLLAREANVVTTDRAFARNLHERLDHLLRTAGERVDFERLRLRPWHQRLFDRLAFGIMRATLFLLGHRY
ncbi:MAG: hypothetical protein RJA36_2241 [Pseudomonadota bacterium]|jgi:cardiolipin synthase